jgi:hypothetical protein
MPCAKYKEMLYSVKYCTVRLDNILRAATLGHMLTAQTSRIASHSTNALLFSLSFSHSLSLISLREYLCRIRECSREQISCIQITNAPCVFVNMHNNVQYTGRDKSICGWRLNATKTTLCNLYVCCCRDAEHALVVYNLLARLMSHSALPLQATLPLSLSPFRFLGGCCPFCYAFGFYQAS